MSLTVVLTNNNKNKVALSLIPGSIVHFINFTVGKYRQCDMESIWHTIKGKTGIFQLFQ